MYDNKIPTAQAVVYVPLAQIYPQFQGLPVAAFPESLSNSNIPPELWSILENAQQLTVRQHLKLFPKACCSCPPCAVQENTYSVYAGLNRDAQAEILRIDEVSDDWNRVCCKPYHPLRLEVRTYVPFPEDGHTSDFTHLGADIRNDWAGLTAGRKQQRMKKYYRNSPPLISILRNDGQRCCAKLPCKWLSTFVCFACCQDGMTIYSGALHDEPNKEVGRPYIQNPQKKIGEVVQPIYAGCLTPTLHLNIGNDAPFSKIEGPCCFGGWSELCFDFRFVTSFFNSPPKTGDVAVITKKKPSNMSMLVTQLISDADVFTIEFNQNAKLTAAEKVTVLTGQLLADYMFFDGNTEKCDSDDDCIYCYCFYCSVVGHLIPCEICIPKRFN